jgi:hypothetical protein
MAKRQQSNTKQYRINKVKQLKYKPRSLHNNNYRKEVLKQLQQKSENKAIRLRLFNLPRLNKVKRKHRKKKKMLKGHQKKVSEGSKCKATK